MGSACGPPIFLRGKLPGEPPSSTREPRMFPKAKIHKLTFLSQASFSSGRQAQNSSFRELWDGCENHSKVLLRRIGKILCFRLSDRTIGKIGP